MGVLPRASGDPVRVQNGDDPEIDAARRQPPSACAIAIPAVSFPWMQPTTSTGVPDGSPTSIAWIGRPCQERPSKTVRAAADAGRRTRQ